MDTYIAKPWHMVIATLLGATSLALSGWIDGRAALAGLTAAVLLWLLAGAILLLIILQERREFYDTVARFAAEIKDMDEDRWQALGIRFPQLRVRWRGTPIVFFEDTAATFDDFERFMRDSDLREISPERNWSNGPERRRWKAIKDWLEAKQYIYPQSASGNHSWLWRGDMHQVLWQRYIATYDLGIVDLNEIEAPDPASP